MRTRWHLLTLLPLLGLAACGGNSKWSYSGSTENDGLGRGSGGASVDIDVNGKSGIYAGTSVEGTYADIW